MPAEEIERLMGQVGGGQGDADFGVWPENWPVARLFLALQTQWVSLPFGGVSGINYAAITPAVLRGLGIVWRDWPDVFERLRLMEGEALGVLRKARPNGGRAVRGG